MQQNNDTEEGNKHVVITTSSEGKITLRSDFGKNATTFLLHHVLSGFSADEGINIPEVVKNYDELLAKNS